MPLYITHCQWNDNHGWFFYILRRNCSLFYWLFLEPYKIACNASILLNMICVIHRIIIIFDYELLVIVIVWRPGVPLLIENS